jgi:hypothetical protein
LRLARRLVPRFTRGMAFSFLFSSYWRLEVRRKIRRAAISDLFTRLNLLLISDC